MASFKALCLAGVTSLIVTASAHAADLLPPPPPPQYLPPQPVEVGSGWYLRGDVGAGIAELSEPRSTFASPVPDFAYRDASIETHAIVGVGVGYQFNAYFRGDVTAEYRFNGKYRATETATGCNGPYGPCADQYGGKINTGVVLANGYLDLGTWYHVTPYVGAGVGAAYHTFSGLTDYNLNYYNVPSGYAKDKNTTTLAYAFMAGVAYDLSPNLKLDFGYRYLDMGRVTSGQIVCNQGGGCPYERQSYRLASHDIRLGLRYVFADLVPYAPPPPLVRKY